jgi:hypothetical protein
MSKSKQMTKNTDHFLTFSDAASLLGSGTHTRITKLVKQGTLPAYSLPLTPKLRVRKSDVYGLVLPSY